MADMDEGPMGSRRSALAFGIVEGNLDRSADCCRRRWRKRGTEHTAGERRVVILAVRRINNVV
jgi:hypothetical protein